MDRTQVIADIEEITQRPITSITGKLTTVLNELARRTAYFTSTAVLSFVDGIANLPANFLYETMVGDYPKITYSEYEYCGYTGYAIDKTHIYIHPAPSVAVTMNYVLSSHISTTTIDFPDAFQEAIVYGTSWKVLEAILETDRAERFRALYEAEIIKLKQDYPAPTTTNAGIDSRIR